MNFMVAEPDCTVADLSALQHFWTEAQYLTLTNHSHRLIEFTDGCIEILPVPAYPTTPGDFAVPVPGIGRRWSFATVAGKRMPTRQACLASRFP